MTDKVIEGCEYNNFTATKTVATGAGTLLGIFVASASATPTLKIQDGSQTIVNTFTPIAGSWYPIPARFSTSCVITVGGTVDATSFLNRS